MLKSTYFPKLVSLSNSNLFHSWKNNFNYQDKNMNRDLYMFVVPRVTDHPSAKYWHILTLYEVKVDSNHCNPRYLSSGSFDKVGANITAFV